MLMSSFRTFPWELYGVQWTISSSVFLCGMWREVSLMMVIILALSSGVVFICWLELHIPWRFFGRGVWCLLTLIYWLSAHWHKSTQGWYLIGPQAGFHDFVGCLTETVCLVLEWDNERVKTRALFYFLSSTRFLLKVQIHSIETQVEFQILTKLFLYCCPFWKQFSRLLPWMLSNLADSQPESRKSHLVT